MVSSWPQAGLKLAQVDLKLDQVGLKLARVGLKLAQDGLMLPRVGPSWPQVGSIWLQVGPKLAQVGPKISPGSLQEALLEGPGSVQAGSWEALGAKRPSWRPQRCPNGLQVTPKSMKNQ